MFGIRRCLSAAVWCIGTLALLLGAAVAVPAEAGAAPDGAARAAAAAAQDCSAATRFDRSAFPSYPKIDNRFLPLVPGSSIVLSGTVRDENGRLHAHQISTIVSGVTKVMNGVRTLVIFERDIEDGALQESELAFQAQDNRGTVWNIGEYPEVYEDGILVGASTWISGVARAKAGVSMGADPRVGTAAYLQGVAPSVEFRDCAQVLRQGQHRCEGTRCFLDVLVIDEFSPLDPEGGHQLKYYAPRVGNIEVGAVGGTDPEVLRLASRTWLSRGELARVNALVLAQDRRGYRVSPFAYGGTARAELNVCQEHPTSRDHDSAPAPDCHQH
jgi:hypothetical protein